MSRPLTGGKEALLVGSVREARPPRIPRAWTRPRRLREHSAGRRWHSSQVQEPKSASARCAAKLPAERFAAPGEHRLRQLERRLPAGPFWQDRDLPFATPPGGPINPNNVVRNFEKLIARAGVARIGTTTCGTRTRPGSYSPASRSRRFRGGSATPGRAPPSTSAPSGSPIRRTSPGISCSEPRRDGCAAPWLPWDRAAAAGSLVRLPGSHGEPLIAGQKLKRLLAATGRGRHLSHVGRERCVW